MTTMNFPIEPEDEVILKKVKAELGNLSWPKLFIYLAEFYLQHKDCKQR